MNTKLEQRLIEVEATLNKAIKVAETKMEEIRAELVNQKIGRVSTPKIGGAYNFIDSCGLVEIEVWANNLDRCRLAIGNVYRTCELAEREVERRKVLVELQDLAGGFVPDWSDTGEEKYHISYNNLIKKWVSSVRTYIQYPITPHFMSNEDCEAAIAKLGSRLDVLLDGGE